MVTLLIIVLAVLIGIPVLFLLIDVLAAVGVVLAVPVMIAGKELIIMLVAGVVLAIYLKKKRII